MGAKYKGSWLFHFNVFTNKLENLGIPLEGSSWPYYNYDWERGIFFAVAEEDGVVLIYDTKRRRALYAGAPKHNISWHRRCTMLDKDTGIFYSTDTVTYPEGDRYRGEQYFVCYTRRNNVFMKMKAKVPANPANGLPNPIRSHTEYKDESGAFWCFSENGAFSGSGPEKTVRNSSGPIGTRRVVHREYVHESRKTVYLLPPRSRNAGDGIRNTDCPGGR